MECVNELINHGADVTAETVRFESVWVPTQKKRCVGICVIYWRLLVWVGVWPHMQKWVRFIHLISLLFSFLSFALSLFLSLKLLLSISFSVANPLCVTLCLWMKVFVCVSGHVCLSVWIEESCGISLRENEWVFVCLCVCAYALTLTHSHTHTHTHSFSLSVYVLCVLLGSTSQHIFNFSLKILIIIIFSMISLHFPWLTFSSLSSSLRSLRSWSEIVYTSWKKEMLTMENWRDIIEKTQ